MRRIFFATLVLFLFAISAWAQQAAPPKPSTGPSEFKVGGAVTTPLDLMAADLKAMPRKTLRVDNAQRLSRHGLEVRGRQVERRGHGAADLEIRRPGGRLWRRGLLSPGGKAE